MKLSVLPVAQIVRRRLLGPAPPVEALADRTWEIAPAERATVTPATFLPGQLERVKGWAFAPDAPERELVGGIEVTHAPTVGFRVRDALLIDGVLYRAGACTHLQPRASRIPWLHARRELDRAAICCTPGGNRYFGTWIMDDVPLVPLARAEGVAVATARELSAHERVYEEWLEARPERLRSAHFRELVVFHDFGQNRHKAERFARMRATLSKRVAAPPHPGVFLLRGTRGERRVMTNEPELAHRMAERRGLRVVDPMKMEVPAILEACAGAQMIMGIEGSAMIHGILMLPPGGVIFTIQPPSRFCFVYKHIADRDAQRFAFVVGVPDGPDFRADPDEIERTLDRLPPPST